MPIYIFTCDDPKSPYHEQPVEELLSIQEYEATKEVKKCPFTGSPMKRVWMDGGKNLLQFKGGGFYCTDHVTDNN